ncbi:serine hydrolase domain-containing protein [Haliscomenobacter sp.]|uniref:serine hydrolase domain-containing protein n=1 Tax=Haliscomenobacter sp. TaxID=2717303 RepID=UPI00359384C6
MKKLIVYGILFQTISLFGQEKTFQNKASDLIEGAVKENRTVGIGAGFSVNGVIKWQQGTGYMDVENKAVFDTTTKTRIASITKPMTAIAIMQLYEQGKLKLDEPIQTYLPNFPKKKEGEITIRQLLQHSSGLDGYNGNKEQENKINYPSLTDALALFKERALIATPGQAFNYTTYGYVVLGLIVEKVSGISYESYLQSNIWDKAQMTSTGIEYFDKSIPNKALIYHADSKGKIKQANQTNLSDRIPGGGVYSTVSDMLKFGDAVLNFSLIKESTFKMMVENPNLKTQGNGYGFGWYLYGENPNYGQVYGHNGTQTGASTFLMLLPKQKTTIVVLSNTSGAIQSVSDITIKLFDIAAQSTK